ncbi:MAG: hypothetical protein ABI970_17595 [Chloroflexota bacterium]
MNRRTLFILLIAFAALVVIALLQTRPSSAPASEATIDPSIKPTIDATQIFSSYTMLGKTLGMTLNDISAIRLRDPESNKIFAISRDNAGNWTAPESKGNLDLTAADNIAKTVALLPYEATIAVKPDTSLADFGFQPDGIFAIDVIMRTNITHAIVIGNLNPSGVSYYGLADDKKVIYVMERRAIDFLLINLKTPPVK